MKASLLTVGSEILDGRVINSNARFLAESLEPLRIRIHEILSCDDVEGDIIRAIQYLTESVDLLIITGGLGPTTDDLTRESLASWAGLTLHEDPDATKKLHAWYESRKRTMDPSNRKQALFPQGALRIVNTAGTADAFSVEIKGKRIICLPGVPREIAAIMEGGLLDKLSEWYPTEKPLYRRSFKVFGVPESVVGSKIVSCNLSPDIFISYRASFPEIHVVLKASFDPINEWQQCQKAIGEDAVFAQSLEPSFASTVIDALDGETLSIFDGATSGRISMLLSEATKKTSTFLGARINVSSNLPATDLARAVCREYQSSLGVSVGSVIDDGDCSNPATPVGTFRVGIASRDTSKSYTFFFAGNSDLTSRYVSYKVLDIARRFVRKLPMPEGVREELL